MRVSINPASPTPPGTPRQLFEASPYALGGRGEFARLVRRTHDVSPDRRRFLMIKNAVAPATLPTPDRIVLVQNWFEDLKATLRGTTGGPRMQKLAEFLRARPSKRVSERRIHACLLRVLRKAHLGSGGRLSLL
jgi:hypothetical protein